MHVPVHLAPLGARASGAQGGINIIHTSSIPKRLIITRCKGAYRPLSLDHGPAKAMRGARRRGSIMSRQPRQIHTYSYTYSYCCSSCLCTLPAAPPSAHAATSQPCGGMPCASLPTPSDHAPSLPASCCDRDGSGAHASLEAASCLAEIMENPRRPPHANAQSAAWLNPQPYSTRAPPCRLAHHSMHSTACTAQHAQRSMHSAVE